MTEVLKSPVSFSGGILKDRSAVSVKRYEAKPPANLSSQLVSALSGFMILKSYINCHTHGKSLCNLMNHFASSNPKSA